MSIAPMTRNSVYAVPSPRVDLSTAYIPTTACFANAAQLQSEQQRRLWSVWVLRSSNCTPARADNNQNALEITGRWPGG